MKGKNESDTLYFLLNEFLSRPHIISTLKFIGKRSVTGCENWFQVEFMRFLDEHRYVADNEIVKEEYFRYDRRKDGSRKGIKLDLSFRIKGKQYYIALELKHCNCLRLSILDSELSKLSRIKPSQQEVYFRKVFALLIHPFMEEINIRNKMMKSKLVDELEFTIPIQKAQLCCTVFSRKLESGSH